jgi:hypothetical protein
MSSLMQDMHCIVSPGAYAYFGNQVQDYGTQLSAALAVCNYQASKPTGGHLRAAIV